MKNLDKASFSAPIIIEGHLDTLADRTALVFISLPKKYGEPDKRLTGKSLEGIKGEGKRAAGAKKQKGGLEKADGKPTQ